MNKPNEGVVLQAPAGGWPPATDNEEEEAELLRLSEEYLQWQAEQEELDRCIDQWEHDMKACGLPWTVLDVSGRGVHGVLYRCQCVNGHVARIPAHRLESDPPYGICLGVEKDHQAAHRSYARNAFEETLEKLRRLQAERGYEQETGI